MIFGYDRADVEAIKYRLLIDWDNTVIGTMLPAFHWKFVWAKCKKFHTVKRWVGTDVLKLKLCWWYRWQAVICNWFIDEHCFVSEKLKQEFLEIFPSEKVRTEMWDAEAEDYVRRFNVLFYVPQTKRYGVNMDWVYGWDIIRELFKKYPEWNWIWADGKIPKNALLEVYHRADVLLRPTRHDGEPRMVREAKKIGVPVVWEPDKMNLKYAEKRLLGVFKIWTEMENLLY